MKPKNVIFGAYHDTYNCPCLVKKKKITILRLKAYKTVPKRNLTFKVFKSRKRTCSLSFIIIKCIIINESEHNYYFY